MNTRRKLGRIASVLAAVAATAGIGFGLAPIDAGQHAPATASMEAGVFSGGGEDAVARRSAGEGEPNSGEHDLSALRLISRVMHLVDENYVDPERISPREMLLGALDFIEKSIPEVLVDDRRSDETGTVALTVNRASTEISLGELGSIWDLTARMRQAFAFIQENLVTTEDTRQIEYAAINGMLSTLDPHSNLLDPEQYSDMKMHTRGEFGGLGFVVSMRDGRLTVMRIIPNTPAHRGGVQARDVITRIEDESTVNLDLTEAVNRLRGKPGTPVDFWIEREGFEEPRKFTLVRAIIEIESVDPVHLLEDDVGYIQLTNFQGNTTRDLRKAVAELQEEADGDLAGLILDLRGNPGGLLEQAIQVSDLFIERGTIVSTVGMNNRLRERKTATHSGTLERLPLVVLVNNNSASASEIVSGAVRNLDRGLVIGDPTFGKGSVQVLYDLVDNSALKLTIAQYLTPGDISIQDMGIVPDIELVPSLVSQ
ncbi:MAG: S41 family peptidase, partial [Myxococcota bacterium]